MRPANRGTASRAEQAIAPARFVRLVRPLSVLAFAADVGKPEGIEALHRATAA
jgi:hypothetical protein